MDTRRIQTCLGQPCKTCGHCNQPKAYLLDELDIDEWTIGVALVNSGPITTPSLEERLRLDDAIEAATLAG
jgi:hypothetical protein